MVAAFLAQRKIFSPPVIVYDGKLIIVLFGESNSGGIAPNSSATVSELAQRNIKILNNDTLEFEHLKIGVNNLKGHIGLESYWQNSHGMELEIANLYDSGYFGTTEVFIVKAGRGGSKTSDWVSGSSAYNNFLTRVNSAKNIVFPNGNANITYMLTIGINDALAGTNSTTYKNGLKDLINRVKTDVSVTKFDLRLMTFDFVTSTAGNSYKTQINEIKNEINGVSIFQTTSCTVLADGNHLNYFGMKKATGNFLNRIAPTVIVCDGNSLTQGQGSTSGMSYPSQLKNQYPLSLSEFTIINKGVGGQTTQQMIADASTDIDLLIDPNKYNVLIAWEGGNDIYYNGNTQSAFNNFKNYCLARKNAGWNKIIVITCPPRGQNSMVDTLAIFNQKLVDYNALLKDNYKDFADDILKLDEDERFQDYNDTQHFDADKVHYNNNGYVAIASLIGNKLKQN